MNDLEDTLFPLIEPWQHAWLQVSQEHHLYYEECGNPEGQPVIVLHGGPGSGCAPGQRRFFDPNHYRIILFDQRGCNRSTPLGCIDHNTIWDLVDDIEHLRQHLDIKRWLVFGGSWGSTLAIAYAKSYPQNVSGMILRGIFLCREQELNWFMHEARQFFPEAWEELVAPVPKSQHAQILQWFYHEIFDKPTAEALSAATRWNQYEASIMSLIPNPSPNNAPDDKLTLARARVQLHYLINQGFLAERPLLEGIDSIRHIPAVIIQGRYDMVCPPLTAHELHQAWPEAEYTIIPDAGHSSMEAGIAKALVDATQSFKNRL